MKFSMILILALVSASRSFAGEGECPAEWGADDYNDKIIAAVKAAYDCSEGVAIVNSCAMGNSNDQIIFGAATTKCAKVFKKKKTEVALVKQLTKRCDAKFRKSQGTMYMSMLAACYMDANRLVAELNTSAE